ncbi:MAG: hypothetical protein H0W99_17155 [Acidobacteria bacterium]|nr:hypothetical protein [Acidobacteriota bacterium]
MTARYLMRAMLLLIGGAMILASALIHATINVPHLREDMQEIGMRPTLFGAVSLVLYFSVIAMFAFAALVLNSALSLLRGRVPQSIPLWLIAGTYLIFGGVAFVKIAPSPHYLGYALMGLLVAIGAALSVSGVEKGIPGRA